MTDSRHKIGVLASGRGSNLQAIIDACYDGRLNASVVCVISDKKDAVALERAGNSDIRAEFIPWVKGKRKNWEEKAVAVLLEEGCELVCLAGYMRIVGGTLLSAFKDKVLNIHPALLPSFPGLHGQEQAFDWGVKVSGCTVHFVTDVLDMGPIIIQKVVPVLEDDTSDSLSARILEQEHIAYPEAIDLVLSGRAELVGRKVKIHPA